MKAIPTTLLLNTSWGYVLSPIRFESRRKAIAYAREAINNGYAFAYRIQTIK